MKNYEIDAIRRSLEVAKDLAIHTKGKTDTMIAFESGYLLGMKRGLDLAIPEIKFDISLSELKNSS